MGFSYMFSFFFSIKLWGWVSRTFCLNCCLFWLPPCWFPNVALKWIVVFSFCFFFLFTLSSFCLCFLSFFCFYISSFLLLFSSLLSFFLSSFFTYLAWNLCFFFSRTAYFCAWKLFCSFWRAMRLSYFCCCFSSNWNDFGGANVFFDFYKAFNLFAIKLWEGGFGFFFAISLISESSSES